MQSVLVNWKTWADFDQEEEWVTLPGSLAKVELKIG
jgi:hypothetical protein